MTVREVARYLSVHPNTVYRLAQQGRLPAFRIGSDWRFNRESINAWRLAQEHGTGASAATLTSEFLEILLWFRQEALQESITLNDLRTFSSASDGDAMAELDRMASFGLVARFNSDDQARYQLTPLGLERARDLSSNRQPAAGHDAELHRLEHNKQSGETGSPPESRS